ncbi:MAG: efflux RND transporter periplasmic adaptor subunit [Alphaproteobacteria bacterium]|nr:MAG: efflux RND transporter periplasmic adaptor subunit [Alphaproteobacteria bacterium]
MITNIHTVTIEKTQRAIALFLKLPKYLQIIIPAVVVGFIAAWLGYYVLGVHTQKSGRSVTVEVTKVRTAGLYEKATVIGSLEANQLVVLRAQVTGTISEIHFQGGDSVAKDSPLITIEDRVYKANLLDAEAQFKTAKADFERIEKLSQQNTYASQKSREQAEAKYRQAESRYEVSKHQLENTVIRAPFDGTVGLRQETLSVGALVDQRQELLRIVDVDPIRIRFAVPASIAMKLHKGQSVQFNVDGQGDKKMTATIDSIDAQVNKATNSLSMYAVASNAHGILRPGLFGRVFLEAGTRPGALVIPEVAVDMSAEESFVYKVVPLLQGGKLGYLAEKVTVRTGIREGSDIEILSGLGPEDHVVTVGSMKFGGIPHARADVVNADDYPDLQKQTVDYDALVRKNADKKKAQEEVLAGKKVSESSPEPAKKETQTTTDSGNKIFDEDEDDDDDEDDDEDVLQKHQDAHAESSDSSLKQPKPPIQKSSRTPVSSDSVDGSENKKAEDLETDTQRKVSV